ncbi:Anthranilate synthase component 1 [Pseudidiomarina piscicola]|uniref:Anthranilate synthase component 1 n=2 Tax=Pseudidiomarina piscicola TaxID=2614830 RepID=A0A6S6WJ69_9GAMM|nr:anthranilate synthase component 1 [Pseudidiomarina piscicola]CAB0149757.1 Anthranilate synthase component 1 [Pseudidiomarina piscicola]VZT39206.1 Anthranilate synthase component 1 [Pseudomonas aeruginosa]
MQFEQQLGYYHSLHMQLPYIADTQRLYQRLCGSKANTLLLDSAEIQSRKHLKSLLMVQASLQITCNGHNVSIKALTANGAQLLPLLSERLQHNAAIELSPELLECRFRQASTELNELDEEQRLRHQSTEQPLRVLQHELKALKGSADHDFSLFIGGVFGYDYIASMEQLPAVACGDNNCPDYQFYLAESLLVVDHQEQTTELLATLLSGPESAAYYTRLAQQLGEIVAVCQLPLATVKEEAQQAPVKPAKSPTVVASPSRDVYAQWVAQLQEHIADGDIFQVVPSRQFSLPCPDSLAAYAHLKAANPSPYMFYLHTDDFTLFGASPESALKYTADSNQVELYPIAGTRPRGKHTDGRIHPDLDSRLELELRCDQKELAEHLMLVDLARNDLARIAQPGTRYVADLLQVDRYSHVMHLVSRVVAQLAEDLDALHAYRACMNMGTLVGAPKVSAARLIRDYEQQRRGSYGGAVGYLSGRGDMDTCIVIRSALVRDKQAFVQAGAGIVADSVASAEVAETEGKAQAVISAIQATYNVEDMSV